MIYYLKIRDNNTKKFIIALLLKYIVIGLQNTIVQYYMSKYKDYKKYVTIIINGL